MGKCGLQILVLAIIGGTLVLANCSDIDVPHLPPPNLAISSSSISSSGSSSSNHGSSSSIPSSSSLGGDGSSSSSSSSSSESQAQPTCGGEVLDPETEYCSNGTKREYGYLTDDRGAAIAYKTVGIGAQTWMAENLNYLTESGSKCYNNDPDNCDKYGRLYNWATAAEDACPSGWHLPSDDEWAALASYVESSSGCIACAGRHLKSSSAWSNGMDTYGFAALPGGGGYSGGNFDNIGNGGRWWTSSEDGSNAYRRVMNSSSDAVTPNSYEKGGFFSIRCIEDTD